MAQILVRNLDEEVVNRLKKRAQSQGRSLQAEVKSILEEAARFDKEDLLRKLDEVRKSLRKKKFSDSTKIIREFRDA